MINNGFEKFRCRIDRLNGRGDRAVAKYLDSKDLDIFQCRIN